MGRPATLKIDIVADAKGVGAGVSDADRKLGGLGKNAARAGKMVGLGLAAAGAAVIGLGVASVKSASSLEQSQGAVQSVFGKSARVVERYAATSATRLGLAGSAYRDLSAVVGSQLKNMGQSQGEAAKSSDKLISLGADLAATFGGSVSDAVGAVGSLLRGERDPIERYGVSLKQADIDAGVAAKGLGNLTGAALKQAQSQVTLELLTKQTAGAQGAFSRESNTLAGQQARLGAQFEDVKAKLGRGLLPMLTATAAWVNERLLPAAKRLGGELAARLGPAMAQVGAFIRNRLVPAATQLYQWFVLKIVPGIRSYVTPVINGARQAFERIGSSIRGNSENLGKLGRAIKSMAEFAAKYILPIIGKAVGLAFQNMGRTISVVITTVASLVGWISTAIEKIRAVGRAIASSPLGKVGGAIGNIFSARNDALAHPPLMAGPAGRLAGPAGQLTGPGRFGWGQFAGGSGFGTAVTLSGVARGVTIIDRRSFTARVDGMVTDPVGAARAIESLLRQHAARTGRQTLLPAL